MATFQPSGPELPGDLILCPRKELTIKMRPVPRVRDPATLQAGPEKDSSEDEEEDADDSDSIQPYLDQPLFVMEKLQVTGHTETDESGMDSGGPWSEGSSAWDASDRSWPGTVDSSLTDEVGSSSCLDKKETDQEPGGDGHPEPLPCLEFSEDSGTVEDLLKDDVSRWRIWDSLPPPKFLVPGESPVSLQMLTFCWDSNPEEEEGEEEEGEEEGWKSEPEGSSADCWGASSLQRSEGRGGIVGDYMAR